MLVAVVLKFVPVMVTVVAIGPDNGEKEVIAGWQKAAVAIRLKKKINQIFCLRLLWGAYDLFRFMIGVSVWYEKERKSKVINPNRNR